MTRLGLVSGSIRTSPKKGGHRAALHGAAGWQRRRLPGRDGAVRSFPGQQLVTPAAPKAERAKQEIDYGQCDAAGYIFGAFQPASGAAFTQPYDCHTTTNDFL